MKRNVKLTLVPESELSIEDLALKTDRTSDYVKKVVFQVAGVGDISWRATKESGYTEKGGFKIAGAGRDYPTIDELPQIVYAVRDALKEGPVTVKASYRQWQYDNDRNGYTFTADQIGQMEIVRPAEKPKKKRGKSE